MKARTFILTAGAAFALVVPAANAASAKNGLYHQAQVHTVPGGEEPCGQSKEPRRPSCGRFASASR